MKTTRIVFACAALWIACWFANPETARAQPTNSAYALSFNGTNQQYVQLPASTWFNGNFTIEAWVYVRSFQNWSRLLDFANGPGNGNVYFALSSGTGGLPTVGVFTNGGDPVLSAPNPLPLNQWVHVALTANGTNGTIYINGNPVISGVLNIAPNITRTNNYFGRSNYEGDAYADAIFDEIRIWNSARSQTDISTYRASRFTGNEPGLVGYWRFDEGSGTVTSNSAAGPNPGQLINGPSWVVSTIATAKTLPTSLAPDGRIQLNATVCPAGLATAIAFAWGTDSNNYTSFTSPISAGSGLTYANVSYRVSGLQPGTKYYFTIFATNSLTTQYGLNTPFTTPQVLTLPPANLTTNSVTLLGSVMNTNPAISAWFEWGATTNYGNKTSVNAISTSGAQSFQQSLSALTPGVTEHYRAVCSNSISGILYGNDVTFAASIFVNTTNLPINVGSFPVPAFGAFAAWGDFNNDGLLDLLYIGPVPGTLFGSVPRPYLFQNVTNGFQDVTASSGAGMTNAFTYAAWLDFDADGRLDLLLSTTNVTTLWHNTGSNFIDVTSSVGAALANVTGIGTVPWDYDNDGRPDLIIPGASSKIWHNTSAGFSDVTTSVAPGLSPFSSVWAAWRDYDGDGLVDFAIGGASGTQLWKNTGNGFINVTATVAPGFSNVIASAAAWGDMNNDGLPDILFSAQDPSLPQLWMNTGNGFTNASDLLPASTVLGSPITLGDYDNDGFLDILGGGSALQNTGAIWRNTGTNFIDVTSLVAPGLPTISSVGILTSVGNVSWGDYDNDGRLDFALTGGVGFAGSGQTVAQIWKNALAQTNTPPSAPTGLSATVNNQIITFHWNPATDSTTPSAGLTYNFSLGTTPGGSDVINPLASANGRLRLPQIGNRQNARTLNLTALAINKPYYWSVQSVDSGFAGSTFSSGTFKLGGLLLPPGGTLIPGDMNGDGVVSPDELSAVLNNLSGPISGESVQQVLSNYLAQAPLYMTNVLGLGHTNVSFALTNSPTNLFSVEYSTNLVDWQLLGPASLRYGFTDTNATTSTPRYYRLRLP